MDSVDCCLTGFLFKHTLNHIKYVNDKKKISEISSIKELGSGGRFDLKTHFIIIQKMLLENIS